MTGNGAVLGPVRQWLRWEGLAILAIVLTAYGAQGASWWLFAAGFFLPDLAILGYLGGARLGSWTYNLTHTYVGPVLCLLLGWQMAESFWLVAGMIWSGHIGFDRALGFGLKYPTGFGDTHLGRLGRLAGSGNVASRSPPPDDPA